MPKYSVNIQLDMECRDADEALEEVIKVINHKPEDISSFYVGNSSVNGMIEVILSGNNIHEAPGLLQ